MPVEQGSCGTLSCTSMGSPHVAGALALLASASKPAGSGDVYALYATVKGWGNNKWIDDSGTGRMLGAGAAASARSARSTRQSPPRYRSQCFLSDPKPCSWRPVPTALRDSGFSPASRCGGRACRCAR